MATITLKYQKNQSHEIRVEDLKIGKVNNKWTVKEEASTASFFMEEYKEAIEMVNAIIALCDSKKEDGKRNGSTKKESESINNRILFVGQRGTGKTSAMTSFSKGLDDAEIEGLDDAEIDNHKALYFKRLPMIDPSNFDNNTNILLTVITMMFSEAKELMKENGNNEDIISTRESLLKQFDEAFKSLKAITGSDRPTFTLEGLNEKSRALQMRTGMHSLVKRYIEFYNKTRETNIRYLVLLIDDIDMTVSHVPEMLEQLRKYLDLDNLIILMSANLGQLYNEMREHYSKAFKETLNDRNQALSIDVEDLANKYLLKIFPTSRRIRVEHSVNQLLNASLVIDDEKSNKPNSYNVKLSELEGSVSNIRTREDKRFDATLSSAVILNNNPADKEDNKTNRLQNVILSLIWQKTRLLFAPKDTNNVLHPIIPINLRELMQFLDMLTSLKPVAEKNNMGKLRLFGDLDAYNNCKDNLGKFKSYILHNWIPNHLSVEEELVFENIPTDITEINKHLINAINMIGTNHKKAIMSREVGLDIIERNAENVYIDRDIYTMVSPNDPKFVKANKISDIFNQPSNYSYGDLLLMIDKYETYFESGDDRKFTDAIKVYYSILLFETMFFDSTMVDYSLSIKLAQAICIDKDKKTQVLNKYPKLLELKEDELYTELGKKILNLCNKKERNQLGEDKDFFEQNGLDNIRQSVSPEIIPIQKLIGGTVYYPNYFEIIKDKYFNQKGPSFDAKRAFYHKLPVDEGKNVGENYPFYAVLYYGDIRPDRYDVKHIYDTTFNNDARIDTTDYVTFDILSILSNMLNPWHTYNRANDRVNNTDCWVDNIMEWGNFCTIEDSNDSKKRLLIPNSILPFYSVDMMLNYLKGSYEVKKIIDNSCYESDYKKYDDLKVKGREWLFSTKTPDNIRTEIEKLTNNISVKDDFNRYVDILLNAVKLKSDKKPGYYQFEDVTNDYLNKIILLLLEKYPESQKERDTLIKELHKYSTPSEIFKHLVETLWDNKVTELLIRSDIQQRVRQNDSVDNYYIKLWEKTRRLIDIADDNAKVIYLNIFNKAAGIFITDPRKHEELMQQARQETV